MRYIFRCDCIVLLAQLVEHVEDSLMYLCTTIWKVSTWLIMLIGKSFYVASLAKHILTIELSP